MPSYFPSRPAFKFQGFTLIELLVVLGVLIVAVGSVLVFLTSVLRGTNQANVSAEVKQNGQALLDTLDSQIRNAVEASTDGSKHIWLGRQDGDPLHIACFSDTSGIAKSENGWIGTVVSTSPAPAKSAYTRMTNLDLVSGVDVVDCDFSIIDASGVSPAVVNMSFVINQGINAPSRQDFVANLKFETTISLRKY